MLHVFVVWAIVTWRHDSKCAYRSGSIQTFCHLHASYCLLSLVDYIFNRIRRCRSPLCTCALEAFLLLLTSPQKALTLESH